MSIPTSEELYRRLKPEPITPEELELANKISPADYEIYFERMNGITSEAEAVFRRIGLGVMVRAGDHALGISSATGDNVATFCALYHILPSIAMSIKYVIDTYKDEPTMGIKDGDIFVFNDPMYGGTHYNDINMMMPIFWKDELIAWAFAGFHESDPGGMEPGLCPSAKNRYQEGLKIVPLKIGENFRLRYDIEDLIVNAVRSPFTMKLDLAARATCCHRIRERILEVLEQKGRDFVIGLFAKMRMEAERASRERIKSWNDGVYREVLFTDQTRPDIGIVRIMVTVTKKDDEVTVDFTGTSPEDDSSFNSNLELPLGYALISLFSYLFHDIPASNLSLAPIKWVQPVGTMVNCTKDAANSFGVMRCGGIATEIVALAMYKMAFDSEQRQVIGGADGHQGTSLVFSGLNEYGNAVVDIETICINTVGQGARSYRDGTDCWGFMEGPSSGKMQNVEDDEEYFPQNFLFVRRANGDFNAGHGKYRGGIGAQYAITPNTAIAHFTILPEGGCKMSHTQGLFGGYPPGTWPIVWIEGCNVYDMLAKGKKLPGSFTELVTQREIKGQYTIGHWLYPPIQILKGEVIANNTGGGSGYGDVLERDPESVGKDLREGVISEWAVKNIYHVAIDPQTKGVNYQKTKELRDTEKRKRIERGKPFDEFEKEWLQKKPPEEALSNYGSWPDAKKVKDIIRY